VYHYGHFEFFRKFVEIFAAKVWEQARGRNCTVCVGRAHEGMAIAAENILDLVREQLHQAARYSSTANI
jgi:hypothetical protein